MIVHEQNPRPFLIYRPVSKCALLGSVNTVSNMARGCSSIIHKITNTPDGYGYEQRDIGRKKYSNIDNIYDYVVL